jgi:hypothetical protein
MKPQLPFLLALALLGCDKAEKTNSASAGEVSNKPAITKSHRPDTPAERKTHLREELKTATENEVPEIRAHAIAEVAWNAIDLEPEIALNALSKLSTDNPERIRLLHHHAMRLAESNVEDALAWADTLGSETETAAAKQKIALVIAADDPQKAASLLSDIGLAGRDFDVAAVQVLQLWSQKSPTDAAAWVVMFPAGDSRSAGIKAVLTSWLGNDAKAAFAWPASLTNETLRAEAEKELQNALLELPNDRRDTALTHASQEMREEIQRALEEAER